MNPPHQLVAQCIPASAGAIGCEGTIGAGQAWFVNRGRQAQWGAAEESNEPLLLLEPLVSDNAEVEEVDYTVFVDI